MRLPIALIAAAAIGIGGAATATGPAAASTALPLIPLVHDSAQSGQPELLEVRHTRRGFRHHRRHSGGAAAAAGIFGFALGAMAGQAFAAPRHHYYPQRYYYPAQRYHYAPGGYHSAHVQWCLNRYRSYDIRTDSFLSYDGFRYRCNSPYPAW